MTIFDAVSLQKKSEFFAFDPVFTGGVRVALQGYDMDGKLDLVFGAGPGGSPNIKFFKGTNSGQIDQFFAGEISSWEGVFV
ncbi:MAG: hypothetical protein EXR99_05335 [Gemmataceae bacterium]|nr:hypothetical protein [Gemmataceae bacterium]